MSLQHRHSDTSLNHWHNRTLRLDFTPISPPMITPRRTNPILIPASSGRRCSRPRRHIMASRLRRTNIAPLPTAPISPFSHRINTRIPHLPLPLPQAQRVSRSMRRVQDRMLRSILRVKGSRRRTHSSLPLFLHRPRQDLTLLPRARFTTIPTLLRPLLLPRTSTQAHILH